MSKALDMAKKYIKNIEGKESFNYDALDVLKEIELEEEKETLKNLPVWRERFAAALELLCTQAPPVNGWLHDGADELLDWVTTNKKIYWSQANPIIDAAGVLADSPIEPEIKRLMQG